MQDDDVAASNIGINPMLDDCLDGLLLLVEAGPVTTSISIGRGRWKNFPTSFPCAALEGVHGAREHRGICITWVPYFRTSLRVQVAFIRWHRRISGQVAARFTAGRIRS